MKQTFIIGGLFSIILYYFLFESNYELIDIISAYLKSTIYQNFGNSLLCVLLFSLVAICCTLFLQSPFLKIQIFKSIYFLNRVYNTTFHVKFAFYFKRFYLYLILLFTQYSIKHFSNVFSGIYSNFKHLLCSNPTETLGFDDSMKFVC